MRMGSCRIIALLIVGHAIAATLALSASSNLVGTAAIQHCGSADGLSISCHDDEAIQLRFAAANDQSVLQIDFVLRGKNVPNERRIVEVFLSSPQRSGRVPSQIAFQTDRRLYPLATNVDSRGVAKSVLALEDFVNLAMMSTIKGTAFGEHFVATDQQMLTLRLALGRWVAYAPAAK
jgi:hypothetical protein